MGDTKLGKVGQTLLLAAKVNKHGWVAIYRQPTITLSLRGELFVTTRSNNTTKMAPSADATVPATRRTRKSISSHTDMRRAMEKENATVDVTSTLAASRKKSRSKSLGPGGLDALRQGSGNRRAVRRLIS